MPPDNSLRKLVVALQVGPATSMGAPTYAQCQPPLPKVSTQSRPSGAPRAAPPGFQRPAAKVRSTPLILLQDRRTCGHTCLYLGQCSEGTACCILNTSVTLLGAGNRLRSLPVLQVAPVSISGGSTCPAREPTPTGFRQCRPSGAPRGAPPGFEPRATEVGSTPSSC